MLDADPSNDVPHPDFDPLDSDGHGTHTGSTVAGINVPGQVGRGVAPKASLYAYKVWDEGNSTDDVLVAAYERAMDPNQDGSIADAVDVLSFSGGVDYGTLNSIEAMAAQRVVDLGTVFVASAGNSGNQPAGGSAYISGTPSIARGVVGVAASIDEFLALDLDVNSPPGIVLPLDGLTVHQSWSGPIPPGGLTDRPVRRSGGRRPRHGATQFCDPLPADSLDGQTVLVFRGYVRTARTKTFNAQEAGAVAVVVRQQRGRRAGRHWPAAVEDADDPVVHDLGRDDARRDPRGAQPERAGHVQRGARSTCRSGHARRRTRLRGRDDELHVRGSGPAHERPEARHLRARASTIEAAAVGTGNEAVALSGTSMAAPHVSGVAVLLRQLHPSWSPAQIKAVLMNQANRNMVDNTLTTPVPATVMGSGRVEAFQSARATVGGVAGEPVVRRSRRHRRTGRPSGASR